MADVIVLRSTGSGEDARSGARDAPPDETPWPAGWLPGVLGDDQEQETADDVLHRYRGARLLYTSGCRRIEVTAAPSDTASVRLTVVWRDDVSTEERAAVVDWWTTEAAARGWRPRDQDDVVGPVVVHEYVPSERTLDEESGTQVVEHDWELVREGGGSRTSGRRT